MDNLPMAPRPLNVADRLTQMAAKRPEAVAVAVARRRGYETCSFAELDADATAIARGLAEMGVQPRDRLVLLVKPGVEFVKLVYALLRSGATTVFVDPGMGRRPMIECLAETAPDGFVAIGRAQLVRVLMRQRFPAARYNVTVGRRWLWGGAGYGELLRAGRASSAALPSTGAGDPAAIIFTSGSTGVPKGVCYTHEMFDTQVREIQGRYGLALGGVDMACFALFGLFNSAMGVTTVFPAMNFSRPAEADPERLLAAANDWQITQAFASPAVWDKLSRHCEGRREGARTQESELTPRAEIPTLRKIFSCGAPVPVKVLDRTLKMVHPGAEMHTPYGATEALPIATIDAAEVFRETAARTDAGGGVCVGRKFHSIRWKVIRISDGPIPTITDAEELRNGEIGELIVQGPQASPAYLAGRQADRSERSLEGAEAEREFDVNALSKIVDGPSIWHRMGDVGYLDDRGRFWYCGRKNHRVVSEGGVLYTECVEAVFATDERVRRAALVGLGARGRQTPVVCIEPSAAFVERHGRNFSGAAYAELGRQLLELAQGSTTAARVEGIAFHAGFPVDVRHNSKINREELARWVESYPQCIVCRAVGVELGAVMR